MEKNMYEIIRMKNRIKQSIRQDEDRMKIGWKNRRQDEDGRKKSPLLYRNHLDGLHKSLKLAYVRSDILCFLYMSILAEFPPNVYNYFLPKNPTKIIGGNIQGFANIGKNSANNLEGIFSRKISRKLLICFWRKIFRTSGNSLLEEITGRISANIFQQNKIGKYSANKFCQ